VISTRTHQTGNGVWAPGRRRRGRRWV